MKSVQYQDSSRLGFSHGGALNGSNPNQQDLIMNQHHHVIAYATPDVPATFEISPVGAFVAPPSQWPGVAPAGAYSPNEYPRFQQERYQPLILNSEDGSTTRLPSPLPSYATPFNDRLPLQYETQGYVHILPRAAGAVAREDVVLEQEQAPPQADFVSDEGFEKILSGFKGGDGKFLAMTAYGAVPLPDKMLEAIPDKFVTKPLIQEREVFVLKQEQLRRVTERDYTQFEHRFVDVPQTLSVDKVEAIDNVKIIEVPHFRYKPVVEDKIIEVPQGIKFVEVP